MTVRRKIVESPRETGARRREGGREADLNSLLTDLAASPPAWPCETRGQVCRGGEYAIAVVVLMNNVR